MKKGFTCGAFDLLHAGHILLLEECKTVCDHLIVGLQVDPSVDRPTKNKPVETLEERKIRLGGCKYVDEIIVYKTEKDLEGLLNTLDIAVRIVGADNLGKNFTGKDLCEKRGIKIHYAKRDHPYSSSSLRERIKSSL